MAYSKILLPVTKKVLWLCTWFLDNIVQNTFSILVPTNFILKRFSLIFLFLRVESTNKLFVLCRRATLIINAVFFSFFFCWLWAVKTGRRAIFTLYSFAFSWLHRPQSLNVLYYWFTESGRSMVHINKSNLLGSSWKFTCRFNSKQSNWAKLKKKKKKKNFMSFILYSKLRCIFIGKH